MISGVKIWYTMLDADGGTGIPVCMRVNDMERVDELARLDGLREELLPPREVVGCSSWWVPLAKGRIAENAEH